jgi:hypothetical protein
VLVLRRPGGAEADDARHAAADTAWLVVQLYRPGDELDHADDPALWINMSKVDPRDAARAIDQADLVVWYEVINPIRVTTTDGGPASDDYSNITVIAPDGHRMVAHAVSADIAPPCLPSTAERVLRSKDSWALARLGENEICQACVLRHG